MAPDNARALFIDESGDAETNLVITAVAMPEAAVQAARASTVAFVHALKNLLPGFASVDEMHAQQLARPFTPAEAASLAGAPPFRTHERRFVYQHGLYHLSEIPGVRVYSVMWRWKGKFAPKGRSGGRRYRDLLSELLAWVDEDLAPVTCVSIDQAGQEPWYRKALDAAQEQRGQIWAVDMPLSDDDELIQLTDLAAFASYQSAIPGKPAGHAWMRDWYRDALAPTFADSGDGYGMRHYEGDVTPVRM